MIGYLLLFVAYRLVSAAECPRTGWIQIPAIEWFVFREKTVLEPYFNQNAYTADGKENHLTQAGGGILYPHVGHARSDSAGPRALSLSWWRTSHRGCLLHEKRAGVNLLCTHQP